MAFNSQQGIVINEPPSDTPSKGILHTVSAQERAVYPVVMLGAGQGSYQATPLIYQSSFAPKTRDSGLLDRTQMSEMKVSRPRTPEQQVVISTGPQQPKSLSEAPSGWTKTRLDSIFDSAWCSHYRNVISLVRKAICQPAAACILIIKIFATAFHAAMIIVGSLYKDDCPIQPFIPIYLIVGGIVGLIRLNVHVVYYEVKPTTANKPDRPKGIDLSINVFLVAWLFVGTVWIYSVFVPEFGTDKNKPLNKDSSVKTMTNRYCDFSVYWLAFVAVSFQLGIVILACFGLICGLSISFFSSKPRKEGRKHRKG